MSRNLLKSLSLFLCCTVAICSRSFAAIKPSNGARLNYTQVMFEYDETAGADKYVITITNKNSNVPFIIENTSLACIVSGLSFGNDYAWHYEAFRKGQPVFKSNDFTFSINTSYLVDSNFFHSVVNVPYAGPANTDIFFLDYRGVAVDRQGKPVWFYPFIPADTEMDPNFRNLRMTSDGNIIFISDIGCYEVDKDGKELWKAPTAGRISGDATETYHHDFKKLDDGTYLTTSYKYEYTPNYFNPSLSCKVRYNTLIQYDAGGNILWSWNEKDHLDKAFLFGVYTAEDTSIAGTHLNAFDYSAEEDAIVMSNRHNSSIVKIDKKTGNVTYVIGEYTNKNRDDGVVPMFLHQHGMAILPDHRLLIYDNNAGEGTTRGVSYPSVIILQEPAKGMPATKLWEYECKSKRFPKGIVGKGGYATPLPNGNILVCMGGANYVFEVTMDKKVVWECSFEKFTRANSQWSLFINYRSNYASSLYPHYTTLEHAYRKKSSVGIEINNEGTEDDEYEVSAMLPDQKTKIFSKTISIKKRSTALLNIPVKSKYTKEEIFVFVKAKSNPESIQFISFR